MVCFLFGAAALHAAPPSGAGWALLWNDEFTGTSLDSAKWRHWLPGARRDAVNSPSAVAVGGGNLVLSTYTSGGTHYTGMISTEATYAMSYGYVEARIDFNDSPGMWSAFWMQSPTMGNPVGSPNSAGTEIDICEHRFVNGSGTNIDSSVVGNIHWDGYGVDHKSTGYTSPGLGLGSGFHIYGMEWTPTQQKFYIDGVLRWTVNNAAATPVSQRSEFIILSSEVDETSTTWAGAIPVGGYGPLAATTTNMTVDYVRVYQRAEAVMNGDFEGRLAPFGATNQGSWSATGGRTDPAAAKIAPTSASGASVQATVRGLMPATDYTLTGWGSPGTISPRLDLGVKSHGGSQVAQSLTAAGYAKATASFTTGATNRTAVVFASGPNSGSTGYADDFLLRRDATVNNGQLEDGDVGAWNSVYGGASVSVDGTNYGGEFAWKIPASGSSAGVEQEVVGLTPSTAYRLSGWTTNGNVALAFGVKNHGTAQVTSNVAANVWTRATVNFTTGASATSASVFAFRGSSAQTAYADSFFLFEPLVAPWVSADISAPGFSGIAGRLGSRFVMQASGANISGTADQIHFLNQPVTGDATITARVLGVDATAYFAKSGVMIRESAAAGARSAALTWGPVNQLVDFTYRTSTNGAAASVLTEREFEDSPWLRLTRRGNIFTAYRSPDGLAWTRIGSQTIAMTAAALIGIPACSGDNARLTEASLDSVSVTAAVPDVLVSAPADGATFTMNGQSVRVTASITDSGSPTIAWSKVSGPGTVTFAASALADTTATFSAAGTYVLRCSATNPAGTGSDDITINVVAVATPDAALTLRLRLDESSGNSANDSSGNGNHGTATGAVAWQPTSGVLEGAADFDGANSYITVPDSATLDNTGAFTLSYWFKANVFNGAGLVAKRNNFNDNNAYSTFLGLDGKMTVDVVSNNDRFTSATTFNTGAWYHIAVVFDGTLAAASRVKLYVNGALDTTANETSTSVPNYTSPLTVGILHIGSTVSFDGAIDDVRFHRRALTAVEISAAKNATDKAAPLVATGTAPSTITNVAAALAGSVSAETGTAPTAAWSKISGPGNVTFGNAAQPATTVTFSQAGSYVLQLAATNANAQTSATLAVSVGLNPAIFADWQAIHWPGVSNLAIIGPAADPNADGEPNLIEFGTAQNPLAATAARPTLAKNGATLEFTYTRSNAALADGVTFTVEWSDTLGNDWSTVGVSSSVLSDDGTTQQIKATIPAGATKRFVHLKVTKP